MTHAQTVRYLLLRALEYCDENPFEPEVEDFLLAFDHLESALEKLDLRVWPKAGRVML